MIAIELPDTLRQMIDARLDNVERALIVSGTNRIDRRQIVSAIEDQIMEMLSQVVEEEPTRDDVLSILAKLDPPEAYLELSNVETSSFISVNCEGRRPTQVGRLPATKGSFNTLAISSFVLTCIAIVVAFSWWILGYLGLTILFALAVSATVCSTIALCQMQMKQNGQQGRWMAIIAISCTPVIALVSWSTFLLMLAG